jgi:hypothetical protein
VGNVTPARPERRLASARSARNPTYPLYPPHPRKSTRTCAVAGGIATRDGAQMPLADGMEGRPGVSRQAPGRHDPLLNGSVRKLPTMRDMREGTNKDCHKEERRGFSFGLLAHGG